MHLSFVVKSGAATSILTSDIVSAAKMSDRYSVITFLFLTSMIAVAVALIAPSVLKRLDLARTVMSLGALGPMMAAVIVLMGAATMALAGHEVGVVLVIAVAVGLASGWVAFRMTRILCRDLRTVADSVRGLATSEPVDPGLTCEIRDATSLLEEVRSVQQLLARSQAERDRAEANRRQTIAGLSHDLRTPLHSLLASVDALEDGIGDQDQNLAELRSTAATMDQLVTDLFMVAQAESGILKVESVPIDVRELVEDTTDSLAALARARQVVLRPELNDPAVAVSDPLATGRILRNLIDNAVRHTRQGGSVTVTTTTTQDGWVNVAVTDEGPGFDPAIVRTGTVGDTGARRPHGGVGLGLRIASTLATAVGGQVRLYPGPPGVAVVSLKAAPNP